jgi:hypothetical protein
VYEDESDLSKGSTYIINSSNLGFIVNDFCNNNKEPNNRSRLLQIQKLNKKTKKKEWKNISQVIQVKDIVQLNEGVSLTCKNSFVDSYVYFPEASDKNLKARIVFVKGSQKQIRSLIGKWGVPRRNLDIEVTGDGYAVTFKLQVDLDFQKSVVQASQQVSQGTGDSGPQTNSGSAPQSSSSASFVNPYNISGVGRVLQDGSIEKGVYYGGNSQLANDLSAGNFYEAAQSTARSASEAKQMCIASNLSSGNIAAAVYC